MVKEIRDVGVSYVADVGKYLWSHGECWRYQLPERGIHAHACVKWAQRSGIRIAEKLTRGHHRRVLAVELEPALGCPMGSRMTQGVRESLWEAFSKCTCPGGAKRKSSYSGRHGNYNQICWRTQKHHLLISTSKGLRHGGVPIWSPTAHKLSLRGVPPEFPASWRAFPWRWCTEASSLYFCQTGFFGSVSPLCPLSKKG